MLNDTDVKRAIGNAKLVVHLATGVQGTSAVEVERSMVNAADNVARACLDLRVERLIHISSIVNGHMGVECGALKYHHGISFLGRNIVDDAIANAYGAT